MMNRIRSTLILSVGDAGHRISSLVESLIKERRPELNDVLGFVNVSSTGLMVLRQGTQEEELGVIEGCSSNIEPGVYRSNFEVLNNSDQLGSILWDVMRRIRRREVLGRLQGAGYKDSDRIYLYLIVDSFNPLGSCFPMALLRLLQTRGLSTWGQIPLILNIFIILPFLLEDGRSDVAMARTHALLSELEHYLFENLENSGYWETGLPRIWTIGSIDSRGGTVDGVESLLNPVAEFLERDIEGILEKDESWITELTHLDEGRHNFLCSFGFSSLFFPRQHLEALALELGKRYLLRRLLPEEASTLLLDRSGEAQGWIREARLKDLPTRLGDPLRGQVVYREPRQPPVEPITIDANRYELEIEVALTDKLEWGPAIRMAGKEHLESHFENFLVHTQRLLDEEAGFEGAIAFAHHVEGTHAGVLDATVGFDIFNLETLILEFQDYFVEQHHAEAQKRLADLERLIPGKIAGLERHVSRIHAEQAALEDHVKRIPSEPNKQEDTPAKAQDENFAASSKQSTVISQDSHEPDLSTNPSEQRESPGNTGVVPVPLAGEITFQETIDNTRQRLTYLNRDFTQIQSELTELNKEREALRQTLTEARRLTRDPAGRHTLLKAIREKDQPLREAEKEGLRKATHDRRDALEVVREARDRLRRSILLFLLMVPAIAAVITLIVYTITSRQIPLVNSSWIWPTSLVFWSVGVGLAVGGTVTLVRLFQFLQARAAYKASLEEVLLTADALWSGQLSSFRKRFEFLLYAEAITVLDDLQIRVRSEGQRLRELSSLLATYRERAEAAWQNTQVDTTHYHRPILGEREARALIEDHKEITYAILEIVQLLRRSQLATEYRESPNSLPAALLNSELAIAERCRQILRGITMRSQMEIALQTRTDSIQNWWESVQEAASAWVLIGGEPQPGVRRRFVSYPKEFKGTSLERFLKDYSPEVDGSEWYPSDNQDHIDIWEFHLAFPSYSISEIYYPRPKLDLHWESVSLIPRLQFLSMKPEETIAPDETEIYVLLQATLDYLVPESPSPGVGQKPADLIGYYRRLDFLPQETPDEFLQKIRQQVEDNLERKERLDEFLRTAPRRDRANISTLLKSLL